MRKPALWLLVILLLCLPALAEPFSLFDRELEVEIPASFRSLDQEAIDQMFAVARSRPGRVFATPDSEARLSFTFTESPLGPEDLLATKDTLKTTIPGDPPVVFAKDEMVTINDALWFRLDYNLEAAEGTRREIIMGTSLHDRLLFIVMSLPEDVYPILGEDIETVISSLDLADDATQKDDLQP